MSRKLKLEHLNICHVTNRNKMNIKYEIFCEILLYLYNY